MADEQQGSGGTPQAQGETPKPIENFDEWVAGQPEPVQSLLDKHTGGLRTALQTERENAKQLAKQLKELGKTLDQSSDAAKQLSEMQGRLETEQRRADFVQEAAAAGCRDLRLAWLAANADGLTLKQVMAQHPDLFAAVRPVTNAGNGAQQATGGARNMNNFIRRAAGRG